MYLLFLILFSSAIYVTINVVAVYLWSRSDAVQTKQNDLHVSIVIIARNEEQNIERCLNSIAANDYPIDKWEVILVDDHSEDETIIKAGQANLSNLRILHLHDHDLSHFKGAHKKAAQFYAIKESKHDIILQTDGDCCVGPNWIQEMLSWLEDADLVTGPVHIKNGTSFLSLWQTFENIGTMVGTYIGIKQGLWYSANAANFAFRKSDFLEYSKTGPSPGASGDDIFFVNWGAKMGARVEYAKSVDAIVLTKPERRFKDLLNQRIRWATKTKYYPANGIKILMASIFIFYLGIVGLGFVSLTNGGSFVLLFFIAFGVKWFSDFVLLSLVAPFFSTQYSILLSPFFSFAHLGYVVAVGILGLIKRQYMWKGRVVE